MSYYLGIDGGGSKTTCAVGDESSLLATATDGPSNVTRVGEVLARESLQNAIRAACAAAEIDPRWVRSVCIGAAGAGREPIAQNVKRIVAELISGAIEVVGDMKIALAAAFGTGPGVIVIAGTGSIAYGRNADGQTARAGGWGFAVSDEGSAHWIGHAAVAGLLRAMDEGIADGNCQSLDKASVLFREIETLWNSRSLDDFVRIANSSPDFAALFPSIVAAADAGDCIGQQSLSQTGAELAQLAQIVARRLFAGQSARVSAAMAGGVFRHSLRVRESFCDVVRMQDPGLDVIPEVVEPVTGALQMARQSQSNQK